MSIARSSPPTITMANGRCESDPMPWDIAAGSRPKGRHQRGHQDRPKPEHGALDRRVDDRNARARAAD